MKLPSLTCKKKKKEKDFSVEKSISLTKSNLQYLLKKYERTRYLMFWHDGSCISNHGHIMMMVLCMYDNGAFVADQEYQSEHGYLQNIQSIVEKPYIYLLARCLLDDHQLLHSQQQINDILKLSQKVEFHGIEITDVMWIFKGDNSASQLKVGNKKMGTISVGNAHCLLHWAQVLYMQCLSLIYHFQKEFLKCALLRHLFLN